MLASGHDDKRRKKPGTTYGKPIRRRGPAYLAPDLNITESTPVVTIELPVRAQPQKKDEEKSKAQQRTKSPSAGADVFDFPCSSDDDKPPPKSVKRRKISAKAEKLVTRPQPRTIPSTTDRGDTALVGSQLSSSEPKLRTSRRSKPITPPKKLSLKPDVEAVVSVPPPMIGAKQPPYEIIASLGASQKPVSKSTIKYARATGKGGMAKNAAAKKISPDLQAISDIKPSPKTPSSSIQDAGSDRSRQISPPALTPRSVKAWKTLLAGQGTSSSGFTEERAGATKSTVEKRSRKRLIDSLVEQKIAPPSEAEYQSSHEGSHHNTSASQEIAVEKVGDGGKPGRLGLPQSIGSSLSQTANGPRVTYSRQRSMLAELDDFSQGIEPGFGMMRPEHPPVLGLRTSHHSDHDEEQIDMQAAPAMSSVHELRQAGATKRFLDEIEDLGDRISGPSPKPSVKRSALMELLAKMHDKVFMRNLSASGIEEKIFASLADEDDEVSAFLLAAVLVLLLGSTTATVLAMRRFDRSIVGFLARLLKTKDSITFVAKQRRMNMSKMAQTSVATEATKLIGLPLWGATTPTMMSPRLLGLAGLALVVQLKSEMKSSSSLLPDEVIAAIFDILQFYAELAAGVYGADSLCGLYVATSILSCCYTPFMVDSVAQPRATKNLSTIRIVLERLIAEDDSRSINLRCSLLSLTLNITNSNENAAAVFGVQSFMSSLLFAIVVEFARTSGGFSDEDERMQALDSLVLMLGIMINLQEKLEDGSAQTDYGKNLHECLHTFSLNVERSLEVSCTDVQAGVLR